MFWYYRQESSINLGPTFLQVETPSAHRNSQVRHFTQCRSLTCFLAIARGRGKHDPRQREEQRGRDSASRGCH